MNNHIKGFGLDPIINRVEKRISKLSIDGTSSFISEQLIEYVPPFRSQCFNSGQDPGLVFVGPGGRGVPYNKCFYKSCLFGEETPTRGVNWQGGGEGVTHILPLQGSALLGHNSRSTGAGGKDKGSLSFGKSCRQPGVRVGLYIQATLSAK